MMQSELEFEWLRQFYVQGHRHRELHAWWAAPMQELLRLWGELQGRLVATLEVLRAASVFDYRSEFATTVRRDRGTPASGRNGAVY
jgi:alpha-ketoglutarate-dependent dioxygenase FTO